MVAWWNSLTGLEQAFAYLAIPATLILVIQTLLLLFGLGHDGDADVDFEPDTSGLDLDGDLPELDGDVPLPGEVDAGTDTIWDGDHVDTAPDAGLRIFTIRGFVAFFSASHSVLSSRIHCLSVRLCFHLHVSHRWNSLKVRFSEDFSG